MVRNPLVSVVAIFRNEIRFLEEAIESVFAQSYDHWELLLVDDASSDGSSALAARYADAHPARVRYLEHPGHANRGTSASRNIGIRHAHGLYVAFLDGDDVWLPPKLEEQVATLEANPEVALVYGATQYWYSWTGDPADAGRDFVRPLGVEPNSVVAPPTLLTLALESRAPVAWPSDFMVRRSVLERIGGFEERFPGLFDDQALLAKLYLREPVFVSDRSWFRYRRHDRSFTSTARDSKHVLGLDYFEWLEGYLAETGAGDEDVRRALREKRARYEREAGRAPERGLSACVHALRALGGRARRSARMMTGSPED
jgi:glycosyltransferase involved in cell wall biosynthesis